ncbi:MAG TPA: alpha/beta hydrolase-fold protein [Kofleriaceae bacterium]|nr:alpha/beta hydrolase-fold protein [Kofleriaceae bacterium]
MLRLGLFGVVWLGCQTVPAPPPTAPAAPAVTGQLALAPGAEVAATRGVLVVTWLTADEKQAFDAGKLTPTLGRSMVTRGAVIGEVDVAHPVGFAVHPPRGRVALLATLDVSHAGLPSLLGGGDGTLTGASAVFEVAGETVVAPPIALAPAPHRALPERCTGAGLTLERVDAPDVAGTVGNPTSRRACVRVPAGYAEHPERHYPVLYALPGLFSTDAAVIASYHLEPADMIVVAVDTSTRTGSTYLVDSATSGRWDTFFTRGLIPHIDAHYRTLARRDGRAIAGHSTGGFNAVSYGLRHPELIGVIAASSPDGLDFSVWLNDNGAPRAWVREFQRVEHGLGGAGQFISYAADWSPTASGYDWPFDASGAVVDRVLQRWLANSPSAWLRDPARVATLKPFSGYIYLTVGETDEFDLRAPTVAFSQQLTAAGIANQLVVTPGGHGTHVEHMAEILKFCATKLAPAQ